MAGNLSFLKAVAKKIAAHKAWLFLAIVVVLGISWFLLQEISPGSFKGTFPEDTAFQWDVFPPSSFIESPEENSWQKSDFRISVFDEDLDSGIEKTSCSYEICSYNAEGDELCSGSLQRTCNAKNVVVAVGPETICRFEGRDACMVFVASKDLAKNTGESAVSYHIDFTPPNVGVPVPAAIGSTSPLRLQNGTVYSFSSTVEDTVRVLRCGFFVNNSFVQLADLNDGCTTQCTVTTQYAFTQEGQYDLSFRCADTTGNVRQGESAKVIINQSPRVSLCTVRPVAGGVGTEFTFSVLAEDPDGDTLSYVWDFGDGVQGNGKEAVHAYKETGTYSPKVFVSDNQASAVSCTTAWVLVL